MRYIEHIVEPDNLLLTWKQSDPDCMRRIVAELERTADDCRLRYLVHTLDFHAARERGFKGYPGFILDIPVHESALAVFMKRLPPRSRRDFGKYLASYRLPPDAQLSDFALLGYSGARLPDDDFTVVCPFANALPPFEFLMQVQGFRHYSGLFPAESLSPSSNVRLVAQFDNPKDAQALRVEIDGRTAGYVPRIMNDRIASWMQSGRDVRCSVERHNGSPERPALFVFVEVRDSASSGAAA